MDKVKVYDPQEVISVSMTREQWGTVRHSLTYSADSNSARATWWEEGCADKKFGAEKTARHEKSAIEAESLRKIIEEALGEAQ